MLIDIKADIEIDNFAEELAECPFSDDQAAFFNTFGAAINEDDLVTHLKIHTMATYLNESGKDLIKKLYAEIEKLEMEAK